MANTKNKRHIWDRFWSGRHPETIYPPVTNIVDEFSKCTAITGRKILEVGAGTGRDGLKMQELGGNVFLLDYSEQSLRMIRTLANADTARMILGDAIDCPFRDGTFDVVFHQGLLEHFPVPGPLLRENNRVLKRGGFLIVDVPQTFHFYTLMKHLLMSFGVWFGGWERQFTLDSLRNLLTVMGFEPVREYGDWSRPGIVYKIIRQLLLRLGICLPMYPKYVSRLTEAYYRLQNRLRRKKIFLYTVLSIGVIARKV
ncbi:MAG: class I SAM-dependent methyltransferase [candidate division WOR-3 bacterium]|nr:MAG: class I SAM-dependent methyltransferase [candidate division WOR-3 bacterium]